MIFPGAYSADSAENKTFRPRRSSSRSRPKSSGIATNHSRLVSQVIPASEPGSTVPFSPLQSNAHLARVIARFRKKPRQSSAHIARVIARFRKKPWQSNAHLARVIARFRKKPWQSNAHLARVIARFRKKPWQSSAHIAGE